MLTDYSQVFNPSADLPWTRGLPFMVLGDIWLVLWDRASLFCSPHQQLIRDSSREDPQPYSQRCEHPAPQHWVTGAPLVVVLPLGTSPGGREQRWDMLGALLSLWGWVRAGTPCPAPCSPAASPARRKSL